MDSPTTLVLLGVAPRDDEPESAGIAGPAETSWIETRAMHRICVDAAGRSGAVGVDVPESTISVALFVTGGRFCRVASATGPGGVAVAAAPFLAVAGFCSLLLPHVPEAGLEPGTWSFTIESSSTHGGFVPAAAVVDVHVVLKRGIATDRGALDVAVHFAGPRWSAASAPGDASFRTVLETIRAIYAAAGIELRVVGYRDHDPATIGRDPDGRTSIAALHAAADRTDVLNLCFAERLPQFGQSGGLPGPSHGPVTIASGVSVDTREPDARLIGVVAAHEMAHYLGLVASDARALSPGQVSALHRHPLIREQGAADPVDQGAGGRLSK